jgi:hypothetical protein
LKNRTKKGIYALSAIVCILVVCSLLSIILFSPINYLHLPTRMIGVGGTHTSFSTDIFLDQNISHPKSLGLDKDSMKNLTNSTIKLLYSVSKLFFNRSVDLQFQDGNITFAQDENHYFWLSNLDTKQTYHITFDLFINSTDADIRNLRPWPPDNKIDFELSWTGDIPQINRSNGSVTVFPSSGTRTVFIIELGNLSISIISYYYETAWDGVGIQRWPYWTKI